jgi:hypothetical protein
MRLTRPSWTLAPVLTWALASACTHYHEPPEGFEGPYTAATVLDRALAAARARVDPLEEADDLTIEATIRLHQGPGDPVAQAGYLVRWQRGGKFAIEVTDGPLAGKRIVSDGAEIAELEGSRVVRRGLPHEESAITRFMIRLFPLHFFAGKAGSATVLEENTKGPGGDPWIQLSKYDASGHKHVLMLDAAGFEPKLLRAFVPYDDGSLHPIDTWLSDVREDVRAGRVARVWKSYEADRLREELEIHALRWNTGIAPAAFTIPGGGGR